MGNPPILRTKVQFTCLLTTQPVETYMSSLTMEGAYIGLPNNKPDTVTTGILTRNFITNLTELHNAKTLFTVLQA